MLKFVINVRGIRRRPASHLFTFPCRFCWFILLHLVIQLTVAAQWTSSNAAQSSQAREGIQRWTLCCSKDHGAVRLAVLWWWAMSVSLNLSLPSGADPGQQLLQHALKGMIRVADTLLDSDFCTIHPWYLLCLSQHSLGKVGGKWSRCLMGTCMSHPGLWAGTVVPLLKEQHEDAFVGTGASKL